MKSNFSLIWSFRNRLDIFKESIASAHKTCPLDINFILVDGGSDDTTIKNLRQFVNNIEERNVRICESSYRTTCQEAWNMGIFLSVSRYIMITSSDCIFLNEGWLNDFKTGFESGSKYIIIENHSLFGIDKKLVAKIGWFDENFSHGPHIDVDYMIRTSEVGEEVIIFNNNNYYSHKDSEESVKNRLSGNVKDSLPIISIENDRYFKEKWETNWPGYTLVSQPHPPTHISQVKRKLPEQDIYPLKSKSYKKIYV